MGTAVVLFNGLFELMSSGDSRLLATIQALIGVGIGAAVFVMTALRAGLFSEEELSLIPAGSKLKRFIITNRSIRNHE
jgi:PST family polysaccharide transporter